MKIFIFLFLLLFGISGPIMKVEGGRFVDIGEVKSGEVVTHDFVIKNKGDETLVITGIGKSCNCTDVSIDSKIIKPGKTSVLTVKVDTHGKSGLSAINIFMTDNTEEGENFVQLSMTCIQ